MCAYNSVQLCTSSGEMTGGEEAIQQQTIGSSLVQAVKLSVFIGNFFSPLKSLQPTDSLWGS